MKVKNLYEKLAIFYLKRTGGLSLMPNQY